MNEADAQSLISLGEGLHTEFKAELSSKRPQSICNEIAAMASTEGGHIFLGVDDDGNPVGLSDDVGILTEQIESWTRHRVSPLPVITITVINLQGFAVLAIASRRAHHQSITSTGFLTFELVQFLTQLSRIRY